MEALVSTGTKKEKKIMQHNSNLIGQVLEYGCLMLEKKMEAIRLLL